MPAPTPSEALLASGEMPSAVVNELAVRATIDTAIVLASDPRLTAENWLALWDRHPSHRAVRRALAETIPDTAAQRFTEPGRADDLNWLGNLCEAVWPDPILAHVAELFASNDTAAADLHHYPWRLSQTASAMEPEALKVLRAVIDSDVRDLLTRADIVVWFIDAVTTVSDDEVFDLLVRERPIDFTALSCYQILSERRPAVAQALFDHETSHEDLNYRVTASIASGPISDETAAAFVGHTAEHVRNAISWNPWVDPVIREAAAGEDHHADIELPSIRDLDAAAYAGELAKSSPYERKFPNRGLVLGWICETFVAAGNLPLAAAAAQATGRLQTVGPQVRAAIETAHAYADGHSDHRDRGNGSTRTSDDFARYVADQLGDNTFEWELALQLIDNDPGQTAVDLVEAVTAITR